MSEMQEPYVIDQQTGEVSGNGPGEVVVYTDAQSLLPRDDTERILNLPERLAWDKKQGRFQAETLDTADLEFRVLGAMLLWAKWSEIVGQPEDVTASENQPGPEYEPGMRLLLEVPDLGFYYMDLWGLGFKFGQGVVKHAQGHGGLVRCSGAKAVNTKFGVFQLPVIVKTA